MGQIVGDAEGSNNRYAGFQNLSELQKSEVTLGRVTIAWTRTLCLSSFPSGRHWTAIFHASLSLPLEGGEQGCCLTCRTILCRGEEEATSALELE